VGNPAVARNNAGFAAFAGIRLAVHTGAAKDPAALIGRALARSAGGWYEPYTRAAAAELAVVAGLPDAEEHLAAAATAARENDWAAACLTRAAGRLRGDGAALTASASQWERIGARFERDCTHTLLARREDPRLGARASRRAADDTGLVSRAGGPVGEVVAQGQAAQGIGHDRRLPRSACIGMAGYLCVTDSPPRPRAQPRGQFDVAAAGEHAPTRQPRFRLHVSSA
jgi:hypothetical protein